MADEIQDLDVVMNTFDQIIDQLHARGYRDGPGTDALAAELVKASIQLSSAKILGESIDNLANVLEDK